MKGALRGVLTPQDARVPRASGRPRRLSARKDGDGGAPTHHGERSPSVGAGAGWGQKARVLWMHGQKLLANEGPRFRS